MYTLGLHDRTVPALKESNRILQ